MEFPEGTSRFPSILFLSYVRCLYNSKEIGYKIGMINSLAYGALFTYDMHLFNFAKLVRACAERGREEKKLNSCWKSNNFQWIFNFLLLLLSFVSPAFSKLTEYEPNCTALPLSCLSVWSCWLLSKRKRRNLSHNNYHESYSKQSQISPTYLATWRNPSKLAAAAARSVGPYLSSCSFSRYGATNPTTIQRDIWRWRYFED